MSGCTSANPGKQSSPKANLGTILSFHQNISSSNAAKWLQAVKVSRPTVPPLQLNTAANPGAVRVTSSVGGVASIASRAVRVTNCEVGAQEPLELIRIAVLKSATRRGRSSGTNSSSSGCSSGHSRKDGITCGKIW